MIRITANFVSGKSFVSEDNDFSEINFDFQNNNNNHLFDKLEKIMMEKFIKYQENFVNSMANYFSAKPKCVQDIMNEYGKIISFDVWDLKNNMKTHITGYDVFAVNDESGNDPTFWENGFVYVVKHGSEFNTISELDDCIDLVHNDICECEEEHEDTHPDLIYAVSLKDLVNEAISSGLLQKLAKKTRFKLNKSIKL